MGDSYAAGIGLGAREDTYCLRYNGGYGPLIQAALQPQPAKFNWPACSGDKMPQILNDQFNARGGFIRTGAWGDMPSIVTLHAGGNDILFKELVTRCIYGIPMFTIDETCDEVIAKSRALVGNPQFLTDGIYAIITKTLQQASQKQIPNFKMFVMGYAQFFNEDTIQCNQVIGLPCPRWLHWSTAQALTQNLRRQLNQLAKDLNAGIEAAVTRAAATNPGSVTFVPIDDLFEGHRFCDRTEPNAKDPETWFITYGTLDKGSPNADDVNAQALLAAMPSLNNYRDKNTANARSLDLGTFINITTTNPAVANSPAALGAAVDVVDVFHPTLAGQQAIMQRLMQRFEQINSGID